MKPYETYQRLEGFPMTERNITEENSKFWGKGKWDNFILPLLPEDCSQLTFVDVGCNAGIHCMLAEEKGFKKVVGIDSNPTALKRGKEFRDKNGYNYDLIYSDMESYLDKVPVADYTVLINSHYYFPILDWLDYVDKLKTKTRYCLIVTTKKKMKTHLASADIHYLDAYFNGWEKLEGIDPISRDGDPSPRTLWTRLYKSPILERLKFEGLTNFNDQKEFYKDLDAGIAPMETVYGKYIKRFRRIKWSKEKYERYIFRKVKLYNNIKLWGMKRAMVLNRKNKIVDGSHRSVIAQHLGDTSGIFRKTR